MDALMLSLLAWVHFHTGYDVEVSLPNVTITETVNLCQNYGMTTPGHCDAIKLSGFYDERYTIYLRARFDDDKLADQARLLHELIHYIQWHNEINKDSCWATLEVEAYRLQDQWRVEHGLDEQADPFKLVMLESACDS